MGMDQENVQRMCVQGRCGGRLSERVRREPEGEAARVDMCRTASALGCGKVEGGRWLLLVLLTTVHASLQAMGERARRGTHTGLEGCKGVEAGMRECEEGLYVWSGPGGAFWDLRLCVWSGGGLGGVKFGSGADVTRR